MFKKFRDELLRMSNIFMTEESRREMDKLNYIKFCCVASMFKSLDTLVVSNLSIEKQHKKLDIEFDCLTLHYSIVMSFDKFGNYVFEGQKVSRLLI